MSNYTGTGTYSGDITVNGYDYTVSFSFKVTGYSDPGRMYMPNGDPGYPPEDGIDEVEVDWESCEPAEEDAPGLTDEEIQEACEVKAWELADDGEFKYDEPDCYDPPEEYDD